MAINVMPFLVDVYVLVIVWFVPLYEKIIYDLLEVEIEV